MKLLVLGLYGYSSSIRLIAPGLLGARLGNSKLLLLGLVVDLLVVCNQLLDSSRALAGRNVVWCAGIEGPVVVSAFHVLPLS